MHKGLLTIIRQYLTTDNKHKTRFMITNCGLVFNFSICSKPIIVFRN